MSACEPGKIKYSLPWPGTTAVTQTGRLVKRNMVFDQVALGLQENFKFSVILQKPLKMMAGGKKHTR